MKTSDEQKKRRLLLFAQPLNEQGIEALERKFECDKPCFMRVGENGGFDPLDAMRRDAYREVVAWLKNQFAIYRKETTNE